MDMRRLKEEFRNPGKDYRSAPFWSWNDRLSPAEVARQVIDMKEHGMGGFFIHSREGLETEYLGPEWMRCVHEAVAAARAAGMNAWLYDEDRWPSGFAGGLVPAKAGDEGRAKVLVMDVVDVTGAPQPGGEAEASLAAGARLAGAGGQLSVFRAVLDGDKLRFAERLDGDGQPVTGDGLRVDHGDREVVLVFHREISDRSAWYNGDCYGDNLNPASVKAFIETTYEAYLTEVGDEFGKTIPGVFTDEPNISGVFAPLQPGSLALPWTDEFPRYFREKRGYDVLDVLPYLFLEGAPKADGSGLQARHDYWRTISELFVEAYSKQLGEWCEAHGLAFTGHFLLENNFAAAIRFSGAIMPHFEYMHVPGIDILTEATTETLTVKQCSSVANQLGKPRVISELYGCSGWEFTFEGQKWVGDWQYALGVNLRCQHLALYTLRGCGKRDYPPSFNYNTTWWKYNKVVEDYFARLSLLLSAGRAVRDILVVHPLASAWCVFDGYNADEANAYGRDLQKTADALLALHRDFDFGDESLMEKYGKVDGPAKELAVGGASYKAVILPPMLTMRESTARLLKGFLDAGGKVVSLKSLPTLIDARKNALSDELGAHRNLIILDGPDEMAAVLDDLLPRRISIQSTPGQEAEDFLYLERALDGGDGKGSARSLFFVVNKARNAGLKVNVRLVGRGNVEEWDALTGKGTTIPAASRDGYLSFSAEFGPAGSRLYMIDPDGENRPAAVPGSLGGGRRLDNEVRRTLYLGPVSRFRRSEPNVLTLDVCQYRFTRDTRDGGVDGGEGEWSGPMPVWAAQKAVREKLGMRSVHTNGIEQRWRWVNEAHPADGTPVELRFLFHVKDVPDGTVSLVLEGAEQFAILLNGDQVQGNPVGWYLDRAFASLALPGLKPGSNELILRCAYTNRMEVEDCFIIGDFGVDAMTREIIGERGSLRFGDWCLQGYPHYAGSIIYETDADLELAPGERAVLTLGEYSAVHVAVWVNGRVAGHIPWRSANGLDITAAVAKGANTIGIEVVGSPRNMLGPLHQKAGRKPWTEANSFRSEGEEYTADYVLQPFGLLGQVRLDVLGLDGIGRGVDG